MSNINNLTTEKQNENTEHIDELSSLEIAKIINSEDKKVAFAVEKELDSVSKAIDLIAERFKKGGRIIYAGAGTSGRLGTLDAVELTPTYNVSRERVFGIIAGGESAMYKAVEGAEDSKELAFNDLKKNNVNNLDTVIAIAASGRTPYCIGAIEYANSVGSLTVSVTCNKESEMSKIANVSISPTVGAEVISGSTRMKAGTAQKMILNMISTGVMIKLGKVYGNYMVNVLPTNEKLKMRAVNIIMEITGITQEDAISLFEESGSSVAVSVVMHKACSTKEVAIQALKKFDNHIKNSIKYIKGQ